MEMADRILKGDVSAAARLMTGIEDGLPAALEILKLLYAHTGRAHVVGITGPAGAGKSTLINSLLSLLKTRGLSVGVLAIDPTSPITGGAVLGDRVRMQRHATDKAVFIRSMATRGWRGGLAQGISSMIHIMDALGKDMILVETAGTGQADTEVTQLSDTSILVLIPGMGDFIQVMKAGILETADIMVINKADKDDARAYGGQLKAIIGLKVYPPAEWKPPIIPTEAICGKGSTEVIEAIFKHKEFLASSGKLAGKRRDAARLELSQAVEGLIKTCLNDGTNKERWEKLLDELVNKRTDPYSAAQAILSELSSRS